MPKCSFTTATISIRKFNFLKSRSSSLRPATFLRTFLLANSHRFSHDTTGSGWSSLALASDLHCGRSSWRHAVPSYANIAGSGKALIALYFFPSFVFVLLPFLNDYWLTRHEHWRSLTNNYYNRHAWSKNAHYAVVSSFWCFNIVISHDCLFFTLFFFADAKGSHNFFPSIARTVSSAKRPQQHTSWTEYGETHCPI